MKRRVVVTGMGVITPIGNGVEDFCRGLYSGRSGADRITRFDPAELPTKIAAEVKGIHGLYRDVKIDFALAAAREAMDNAFGMEAKAQGSRSLLSIGIGLELFSMEDLVALKTRGYAAIPDADNLTFLNTPSDICAHLISRDYGFGCSPELHISACAASTDAIGAAFDRVAAGEVDVALAGGTDSMINPMGVAGFCRIDAMTQRNDAPSQASRPFDRDRNGFLLGEGAGFVVLEAEAHAKTRGAKLLAAISGYGNSLDAYSISDPHPHGAGALKSMKRALQSAGLGVEAVSAVSPHGTGTPKNDPAEAQAIRALLGERWTQVPVFATKSLVGHCISAAGVIETVAAILALRENRLHATLNLTEVGEGCELRHVTGGPLEYEAEHILKNSFAFGGQNASIVISRIR